MILLAGEGNCIYTLNAELSTSAVPQKQMYLDRAWLGSPYLSRIKANIDSHLEILGNW
jgi:hypothetical protein